MELQGMSSSSSASASQSNDVRVKDVSHLLIRESLPLTGGGYVDVDFYHPVLLVQEVLDRCDNLSKIYISKLEGNPATAEKPWRIQCGCDEHTPGSNRVWSALRRRSMHGRDATAPCQA